MRDFIERHWIDFKAMFMILLGAAFVGVAYHTGNESITKFGDTSFGVGIGMIGKDQWQQRRRVK